MIGLIVSGGQIKDTNIIEKYYKKSDFCVAVDKGVEYLIDLNIKFDIAIGDFDSINKEYFKIIKNREYPMEMLNIEKDNSDTEAAVDYLIEKKCSEIFMLSCTGSRLDHTISNILLLKKIRDNNIEGYIIDENNKIRLSNSLNIVGNEFENISIIPLDMSGINVTLEGFYYKLDSENIEFGSSRCLSNYLIESVGKVYINKGNALIIESRD
ncbi:thiamine diphosphokinase [Miniphocaeibacter massiliensis]|uniref:thiamine diphosphokinase n=1 Tax=Miniphocaeibacter massiliensis TaxID=2041841 RepID=UPI000C06C2A6|nr:thiamine diphosphokinase [Miniphocaeibacter massiliensis]